jgi:hypothetical protein
MKVRRRMAVSVLIFLAACWVLTKVVVPSMKDLFASKPVVIDKTSILIKEIRSIGQLITFTSFDEVVADSTIATPGSAVVKTFNRFTPVPLLPSADKKLVLIGRGKILAGTDLRLLTDSSISIQNDTVTIRLPQVAILDAILNPSDFETFVEKGNWSEAEVILVKAQARRKMVARAIQRNILPKAEVKAKAVIENFVGSMGFKAVLVN